MAHATMLGRQGIIEEHEAEKIINGLKTILWRIERREVWNSPPDSEDIHMNVEVLLTARIGDAGKRLHTARSGNDQVALDFRMYVKEEIPVLIGKVLDLERVLVKKAKAHLETVMPGYTHLQRAQPISFAHHLMAYASMFLPDVTRLEDCGARHGRVSPGHPAPWRAQPIPSTGATAEGPGLRRQCPPTTPWTASDRDYALELLSGLSILMMHLTRFSEEVILWCSWEFKFIELDDAYATGSSIMPQKKNPDVAELVRGKTGRVYGDLMGLLTAMKGLPLAYNKDMQEDKEPVFDAVDTVEMCLPVFAAMLDTMTVRTETCGRRPTSGFINATDCADYLTKKGMPFRDAYTAWAIWWRPVHQAGADPGGPDAGGRCRPSPSCLTRTCTTP